MDFNKIISLVLDTKAIVNNKNLKSEVAVKGKADFVTGIDLQISSFLKEKLLEIDSRIGFFSEEETGKLNDPCWILDPIDGTTNLIFGYRLSSVSLGLFFDGQIVFGCIYNPFTDEVFTAERDKGAFLNGTQIYASTRKVADSIIEFGADVTHKEFADDDFLIAKTIFRNCVDIRRICSSALDLCYIADSRIDGYFESVLKPWDIAAGSLILTEAGGKITDFDGNKIAFDKATSVIASNGIIHDFLQQTIKSVREE